MNRKASVLTVLIVLFAGLGLGPPSNAVRSVREGIDYFSNGEFEQASASFDAADEAEPDNEVIVFDRACALKAVGDADQAKELFRQAALSREIGLSSDAHYNLGCLAAEQGRDALGEDPVAATPEQREEGIRFLLAAVGHYRDCLDIQPKHSDARHNLELIRLFIKNIQAQWEERDREKDREEKSLLEFLAMIEQRQSALRSTTRLLGQQEDSPQRRQAAMEWADAQRTLAEEIEPLKEKIANELQTPTPQANASPTPDPQTQQALELLHRLADEAAGDMGVAAERIEAARFEPARDRQRGTLDRLNEIYMAIVPYPSLLQRATRQQEQLVGRSESIVASELPPPDDEPVPTPTDPVDTDQIHSDQWDQSAWEQTRITDWARVLGLKAESELPALASQLQQLDAQAEAANEEQAKVADEDDQPDGEDEESATQDPRTQLESLKASMEKAIERTPKVIEHSETASGELTDMQAEGALPEQQEALRLLKEISEPLQDEQDPDQQDPDKQDQDQDQSEDQQDNNEDQQNGEEPEQNQEDPKGNQQQDLNKDPQQSDSPQNQDSKQNDPQQSRQQRAMSAIRRARERERDHREMQKELQRILGGRLGVERDW